MTLYRDVAAQEVFFALVNALTGAAESGATVAAWITRDAGAQAVGAGTVDDLGNGQYRYNFSQAETDGATVGLMLLAAGCVPLSFSWTTAAWTTSGSAPAGSGTISGIIPTLVTLDQARTHLRLSPATDGSPSVDDVDLQMKIDAATQMVCEHISGRQPADPAWIATIESWGVGGSPFVAPPPIIVLATLVQLGEFFQFRGDNAGSIESGPSRDRGYLSQSVANLLTRYHDPALA